MLVMLMLLMVPMVPMVLKILPDAECWGICAKHNYKINEKGYFAILFFFFWYMERCFVLVGSAVYYRVSFFDLLPSFLVF